MDHDEHRWPGDRRTKQAAYPIELKNDMASGNDSSQGKEGREGEREEERGSTVVAPGCSPMERRLRGAGLEGWQKGSSRACGIAIITVAGVGRCPRDSKLSAARQLLPCQTPSPEP